MIVLKVEIGLNFFVPNYRICLRNIKKLETMSCSIVVDFLKIYSLSEAKMFQKYTVKITDLKTGITKKTIMGTTFVYYTCQLPVIFNPQGEEPFIFQGFSQNYPLEIEG